MFRQIGGSTVLALLISILLSVALATPAAAIFAIEPVNEPLADCGWPAVANSPDGLTMIAWVATETGPMGEIDIVKTQLVNSLADEDAQRFDPVSLGPGTRPALCWSREGFTLALASGEFVVIYQSDENGAWDLENFTVRTVDAEAFGVINLDLWGNAYEGAGAHVFLCMGGMRHEPDYANLAYYAGRTGTDWSEFELVADAGDAPHWPQMSFANGRYGPLPRVYYVGRYEEEENLVYRTKQPETGWDDPVPVPGEGGMIPGPIGSDYDVAHWDIDTRAVLGCGPQPTCPCNVIHYIGHDYVAGWQDPENLTVDYGLEFDWPQSPSVSADAAGSVHALWYQQAADQMMVPQRRRLEYWIQENGEWTDASGFLDDSEIWPTHSRVAMALMPGHVPVLVWAHRDTIDGEPQPQAIWMARRVGVTAAPENDLPAAAATLAAHPNPFNPRVTISFAVPIAGDVELAVFDLRGRRVAVLFEGPLAPGASSVVWDGTDGRGRAMPGGVYLARLAGERYAASVKLVLAR